MSSKKRHPGEAEQLRGEPMPDGLYFSTWAPGDGATRYRFFDRPGNSYHGPDDGIFTALGTKEAHAFMSGWRRCKQSKHTRTR